MNMSAVINIELENNGNDELLLLHKKRIGIRSNCGGMFFFCHCLFEFLTLVVNVRLTRVWLAVPFGEIRIVI